MRRGLLKDLESICNMASEMCGTMHGDDCDETRDWIDKVHDELRRELGARSQTPPLHTHLRRQRSESKGIRRAIVHCETTRKEVHGEDGIYQATVHDVTLECGHTKRYTGNVRPKLWTRCRECGEQ